MELWEARDINNSPVGQSVIAKKFQLFGIVSLQVSYKSIKRLDLLLLANGTSNELIKVWWRPFIFEHSFLAAAAAAAKRARIPMDVCTNSPAVSPITSREDSSGPVVNARYLKFILANSDVDGPRRIVVS